MQEDVLGAAALLVDVDRSAVEMTPTLTFTLSWYALSALVLGLGVVCVPHWPEGAFQRAAWVDKLMEMTR